MPRVLITYARGWHALAAARSLGKRGIEVIAGDEYAFAPATLSKYTVASFLYPSPDREPEAFLEKLEEMGRKHAPDDGEFVLMPFHKETYLISKHRERFGKIFKMALPEIERIEQVHDKGALALYCQEQGIPSPKTGVPSTREDFREIAAAANYPAFVKVRRSASAVGVKKVDSPEEAVAACEEFITSLNLDGDEIPILQEGVPGDDYCSTFLFDHGEPRAAMTYHNLRSFPPRSGTGVLRETVRAGEMEKIGEQLLAGLDWHGVAEVDFRWEGESTQPLLIEVNPRFWGGLTQAIESGWDYPHFLYRLAVDGRVDPVEAKNTNVRTETPVISLLATLHEIAHDEPRMEAMKKAFEELKGGYVRGNRRSALRQFIHDFKDGADLKGRWEHVRSLFRDHKHAIPDILQWRDPKPALGFLYPLAVFLKHGKVSTELLVSEGRGGMKAEDDK